jgi:hypothetical protein
MDPMTTLRAVLLLAVGGLLHAAVYNPGTDVFPVTKVQDNGDDTNRLVWTFVGDGFTAGQQTTFLTQVDAALTKIFAEPPWSGYRSLVNVYAIQVVSNESGADEPPNDILKDTYFNASFYTNGIARLLTVSNSRVYQLVNRLVPTTEDAFCLVNATRYGGAGGSVAVASIATNAISIVAHEYGHTFCGLADEYESAYPGYPHGDPEDNVQIDVTTRPLKWAAWVANTTPIPTPDTNAYNAVVGAFEGARYKSEDIYRPRRNCAMRSVGAAFCEVCRESHVVSLYEVISPLASTTPSANEITLTAGQSQTFTAAAAAPNGSTVTLAWTLDGADIGSGISRTITQGGAIADGVHTLAVTARDTTDWVRNDPNQRLARTRTWTVRLGVLPPTITVPASATPAITFQVGTTPPATTLRIGATDNTAGLTYQWLSTGRPPGANLPIMTPEALSAADLAAGVTSRMAVTLPNSRKGTYAFTCTVTDAGGLTATSVTTVLCDRARVIRIGRLPNLQWWLDGSLSPAQVDSLFETFPAVPASQVHRVAGQPTAPN